MRRLPCRGADGVLRCGCLGNDENSIAEDNHTDGRRRAFPPWCRYGASVSSCTWQNVTARACPCNLQCQPATATDCDGFPAGQWSRAGSEVAALLGLCRSGQRVRRWPLSHWQSASTFLSRRTVPIACAGQMDIEDLNGTADTTVGSVPPSWTAVRETFVRAPRAECLGRAVLLLRNGIVSTLPRGWQGDVAGVSFWR